MRVLLSIKPEFAEKILTGEKKFEYRRRVHRRSDVKSVIIYATSPLMRIVGEFDIQDILRGSLAEIWDATCHAAGISEVYFKRYFEERSEATAICVGAVKRYDVPFPPLAWDPHFVAPQSYRYVIGAEGSAWPPPVAA